jgi:uncharacterized protein YndB with AHSA1/START domain
MTVKPRTIRKEIRLPHSPEDVWLALTDPQALAEWLMPNNFQPIVGRKFRFHVDPMPGPYPGGSECEVLEVDAPRRISPRACGIDSPIASPGLSPTANGPARAVGDAIARQ